MNYPLISEYIEAIKSAEDNFEELSYLRPVLGEDGLPVMTSGNFAVVFKMKDEQNGKFYAVKCFTKEQEGRADAYREIAKELKDISSPYLVSIRYFDEELFVDTDQTTETEFPVLLMDWVEGKTLDKYLRENLDNKYALEILAYRFSQLAQWLIPHPFAHGDLKPDNILVREDGSLVLVDYDGMYVPAMKGQKARELGSPDFRHPQRTENDFNERIDDFPLVTILLSLKTISFNPQMMEKYSAEDRLLLSKNDFLDLSKSQLIADIFPSTDSDVNRICSIFTILLSDYQLVAIPPQLYTCHVSLETLKYYYELGENYRIGDKGIQDGKLAVQNYKIAAELGLTIAQYSLGVCYKNGFGVEFNYQKALYWFEVAAKQGDIRALYNQAWTLCQLYNPLAKSIYESVVKKAECLIKGNNDINAYGILGLCLYRGLGVAKDISKAFNYFEIAAEHGEKNAQAYLGYCYYSGQGVPVNKENAIKWFKLASKQGDLLGMSSLGLCYWKGDGVPQDKTTAIQLLQKSANQCHPESLNILGTYYFQGNGIEKDMDMAFYLFSKSAERENKSSMYNLAQCFEYGYGTLANRDKARYWYEKAAEKGEQNAIKALERFKTEDLPF